MTPAKKCTNVRRNFHFIIPNASIIRISRLHVFHDVKENQKTKTLMNDNNRNLKIIFINIQINKTHFQKAKSFYH